MSSMRSTIALVQFVLVLPVLSAGCQADDPLGPGTPSEDFTGPGTTAPDPLDATTLGASPPGLALVAGEWEWRRLERLSFPDWFAAGVLGIAPEGPTTRARCDSRGTMVLEQTRATFDGTAVITSQQCRTAGGQGFVPPGGALPLFVVDGRRNGTSLRFSFENATVRPCPYHAEVTAILTGQATALEGGGRCILPGHPRSESPVILDPPPGGTSIAVRWSAIRR